MAVVMLVAGCEAQRALDEPVAPPRDGGTASLADAGAQLDAQVDARPDAQPDAGDLCHTDCRGQLFCNGPQIMREASSPIPEICRRFGNGYGLTCGEATCAPYITDARYKRCDLTWVFWHREAQDAHMEKLRCTSLPVSGSPCLSDSECHPMADVLDGNLRCESGKCVATPRRAAEELRRCDVDVDGGAGCVTLCGVSYQPEQCYFDEACPAGMDCATGGDCQGVCLPRAFGRDPANPTCPQ
ncbi:hypothetical protein OUZ56_032580 [Daphnia magna]|uniref:Lipoprotein n=1 Tax=Daphnia magna TaxID=35525 RepID=A0ABR0B9B7_9CRUS|nr:hypothetical protein OUZ56_032580 [Daphnia magna]